MGHNTENILSDALRSDDFNRLNVLSAGRLETLFLYDPESHCFEPAEANFSSEDLDSIMRAADVLTARHDDLDLSSFATTRKLQRMKHDVQYRFGPGELDLFEVFKELLERHVTPGGQHVVHYGAGLDGPIITITVVSHTEREYKEARDHISWLYDLSKRELSGEPYKGFRPY